MTTTTPTGSSNKLFVLLVVGVIVIGLGGVALLAANRDRAIDEDIESTAAVELDGDALPGMPQGVSVTDPSNDPAVGTQAPEISGTTFDGTEMTIGADGRPKVIYFLAHWCPHCQEEVPKVQELIEQGEVPDGVDLYAVSTGVDQARGNFPPYLWLDREGFEPTTVRDDAASTAYSAFGAGGFPFTVYLDGQNQVVARSSGELPNDTITSLWSALALIDADSADERRRR